MSDIRATVRQAPRILETVDDKWDWEEVQARTMKPTIVERVRLAFRPWLTVLAPKGTRCAVTTMRGEPLYEYKELNGAAFYLRPQPGPGFPGS